MNNNQIPSTNNQISIQIPMTKMQNEIRNGHLDHSNIRSLEFIWDLEFEDWNLTYDQEV
jgi:hypothetical protein